MNTEQGFRVYPNVTLQSNKCGSMGDATQCNIIVNLALPHLQSTLNLPISHAGQYVEVVSIVMIKVSVLMDSLLIP